LWGGGGWKFVAGALEARKVEWRDAGWWGAQGVDAEMDEAGWTARVGARDPWVDVTAEVSLVGGVGVDETPLVRIAGDVV